MVDVDARLAALEKRVRQVEDVLAIYRTLASYGPAADSDSRDLCGDLFTDDAWWEVGQPVWAGGTVMEGPEGVRGMMGDQLHQYYLANGCAHLVAAPRVTLVDDDTAAVITYQHVVDHVDDGFRIARSTAHKFEMKRGEDGRWRIHRRSAGRCRAARSPRG